jgi:acyl transferase domain-containing protein
MVILKPLSKALADGDSIRAVIMGTGINQDGKTPGITMPNAEAQGKLKRH